MVRLTTSVQHISVIIPVFGEMAVINDTVRRVRETAGEPVEIVVSDGGPGHDTLAVIEDPDVVRVRSRSGRGIQMNTGAAEASGGILLFLHADTLLPDGWAAVVRAGLADTFRAGAFSLAFDSSRVSLSVVAFFANLRTCWERIPYGDQVHFITADFFGEMNGYAAIPIMEDVELFLRIRQRGERIALLREHALTSPRRFEADGVLRRVLSNWRLRLRFGFGASPSDLVREYRPHDETGRREGNQ